MNREHAQGKVIYSGDLNVEILKEALRLSIKSSILKELDLEPKTYALFTLHRAENTLSEESLISVLGALEILSEVQIIFPIHPRTRRVLQEKDLFRRVEKCKNLRLIEPLGYIDFVKLMQSAYKIITDSGGVQKESYLLHVPCVTIRENTEWVETVKAGWNVLAGTSAGRIINAVRNWWPTTSIEPIFGNGDTSKIIRHYVIGTS